MSFRWSTLWLIVHILSVLAAFGPTFAFGLIGSMALKEPQHALFAAKLTREIDAKLIYPIAVLVAVSGVGLVVTKRYDFWGSTFLIVGSGLFAANYAFSFLVQRRWGHALEVKLEAMSSGQAGPETGQELMTLGKKARLGGMALGLVLLAIITLMVWRPGAEFLPPP